MSCGALICPNAMGTMQCASDNEERSGAREQVHEESVQQANRESRARTVLLKDGRFQRIDAATRMKVISLGGVTGTIRRATSDAVMTQETQRSTPPSTWNPSADRDEVHSKANPTNLNGFFFGATERENLK